LIENGLNGAPRSFRWPCSASAAEIARKGSGAPFGRLRLSALAKATTSGLSSAWLFLPSHLPFCLRLRSRAALSFLA
jgi:hypothetical protein